MLRHNSFLQLTEGIEQSGFPAPPEPGLPNPTGAYPIVKVYPIG
jgi:hypothetical protein